MARLPSEHEQWERVGAVFEQALAVPPDARDAFLAEACSGDERLRAEVAALLDSLDEAEGFFAGLSEDVVQPSLSAVADDLPPLLRPGDRIGHYEVETLIGQGGMGVVYKARDTRLGRIVALKVLPPRLARDDRARERLLREAQAAATLDHPNVCTIYSIEQDADGPVFIVMRYYAGETLRDRLERGPIPTDEALGLLAQMARGLAAAHANGVIHRDLKPANVLLTASNEVKLLDFGIAKRAFSSTLTRTGTTLGTVAYMAPEQARGEAVDGRVDLWSLGVMAYEMLSGDRPFDGDTEAAILYAVLEKEPPPIAASEAVPASVVRVVRRLLEKNPEHRYANAEALLADVQAVQEGRPIAKPSVSSTWDRRRWGWAVAAVVALVVVGLVALWQGGSSRPMPQPSTVAVLPFTVRGTGDMAYLREGMVDLLSTKLNGVAGLKSIDPNALLTFAENNTSLSPVEGQALAHRFDASHYILGRVLQVGSDIELHASLYEADGKEVARTQVEMIDPADLVGGVDQLAQQLIAGLLMDPEERLASLAALTTDSYPALVAYLDGERYMREGQFEMAKTALMEAVERDSAFALAWYRLARAAGWTGDAMLNMQATNEMLRFKHTLPERTQAMVEAYREFRKGDPLVTEQRYRTIVTAHPDDAETWQLLGEALFHNNPFYGRPSSEARAPLERALMYAPHNREILVHLIDLALQERRQGELDTLLASYLAPESGRPDAHLWSLYASVEGLASEDRAQQNQAIRQLEQAGPDVLETALVRIVPHLHDVDLTRRVAERLAATPQAGPGRATGLIHVALCEAAQGRYAEAEALFAEAAPLAPGWTLIHRTLAYAAPHLPVDEAILRALRDDVTAWNPGVDAALYDGQHAGELPTIRLYLLGLLSLKLHDPSSAMVYAMRLRDAEAPNDEAAAGALTFAQSLALTLEGYQALVQGDARTALARLEQAQRPMPYAPRNRSPLHAQYLGRYLCALALMDEGQPDEALAWFEALHDTYYHWGTIYLGPSLWYRAALYDDRGEPERAAALRSRFDDLWQGDAAAFS